MFSLDGNAGRHSVKVDAARRLADLLRTRILTGTYRNGDQLATEAELMLEYGSGRNVVRNALDLLRHDRYITRRQGRGTMVISQRVVHDLCRPGAIAADFRGGGNRVHTVFGSLDEIPAPPLVAERLALDEGSPCVRVDHGTLIDHEPYSLATSYLRATSARDRFNTDLAGEWVGDWPGVLTQLGFELGRIDLRIEAVAADVATASVLGVAAHSPLLRFERLLHDRCNRPLDFGFLRCRSDRVVLHTEVPA